MTAGALLRMRRFAAPRSGDVCDLCAAALPSEHDHVVEPAVRALRCVCRPCALLFPTSGSGQLLRVEPRAVRLVDFELDDARWAALGVPVGLAYFYGTRRSDDVIATFPGRAGTVESVVPRAAWNELCGVEPAVAGLALDTEALLVSRTQKRRRYFQVSIDRCYELAGLLQSERGPMSMADPEAVDLFFANLEQRCAP